MHYIPCNPIQHPPAFFGVSASRRLRRPRPLWFLFRSAVVRQTWREMKCSHSAKQQYLLASDK